MIRPTFRVLQHGIHPGNHDPLLVKIGWFVNIEVLGECCCIFACNLPEPLDRKTFGIDENDRFT